MRFDPASSMTILLVFLGCGLENDHHMFVGEADFEKDSNAI
jgi:hypothetical protein